MTSAVFCEHANECPSACPCPRDCYCQTHTCAGTMRFHTHPDFAEQPNPIPNELPAVWDLVMADMTARDELGRKRYGARLQPHNGRDALRDTYEELLDAAAYVRQALFERDGK